MAASPEPFLPMQPPVYPRLSFHRWGDRPEAIETLLAWVHGRSFHPYADDIEWWKDIEGRKEVPAELNLDGRIGHHGRVEWFLTYRRAGTGDSGHTFPYSHPADACRAALESIEEREREEFESGLVLGVA